MRLAADFNYRRVGQFRLANWAFMRTLPGLPLISLASAFQFRSGCRGLELLIYFKLRTLQPINIFDSCGNEAHSLADSREAPSSRVQR